MNKFADMPSPHTGGEPLDSSRNDAFDEKEYEKERETPEEEHKRMLAFRHDPEKFDRLMKAVKSLGEDARGLQDNCDAIQNLDNDGYLEENFAEPVGGIIDAVECAEAGLQDLRQVLKLDFKQEWK